MPARWRVAGAVLVVGIGVTWLGQVIGPSPTAPLFDGIFIEDPYLFVDPPPGADGNPLPIEETANVTGGAMPLLVVATLEVPPQAQIIAQADAFDISADVTSVIVSIAPSAPTDPQVVGNVYKFSVTDQDGSSLTFRPSALVSIVLRAPLPDPAGRVVRFDGTRWVPLPTDHGGLPDLFSADINQLGDYAVVLDAASPSASAPGASAVGSPAPSNGPDGPGGELATPTWLIVLLVVAAIGIGLGWGLVGDDRRR